MTVWSIIRLIFFMFIVPMCIGQLFKYILKKEMRRPVITYLIGFFAYFGVVQIISIFCVLTIAGQPGAFETCFKACLVAVLLLTVTGIFMFFRFDRTMIKKPDIKGLSIDTKVFYGIFIALVLFQMIKAVVSRIFDGDNTYYVTQSVIAQKIGAMYTVDPYKGGLQPLDVRHALAVVPMWIAFIGKACGVHATIVAYTAMPLLIIPLVYIIYHEISKVLFADNVEMRPIFMIIVNILMIFGNVSIFTPATFFLMRTWQGKSMLTSIAFPMIVLIFLWIYKDCDGEKKPVSERASLWAFLFLVNMFSGMCTEMGVVFGAGLVMLLSLILLISSKRWTVVLGAFCSIIPNLVYLILFFGNGGH
ncbi:MAG: hypothetical protein J5802_03665 [Butyrivibrio sp.]|nr:hypothetical protein [Butyrivibrio sp.]